MKKISASRVEIFIKMMIIFVALCLFKQITDSFIEISRESIRWWSMYPWFFSAIILGILLRAIWVGSGLFQKKNWRVDLGQLLLFCLPILLILIYLHFPTPKPYLPKFLLLFSADQHYDQLLFNIFGYSLLSSFVSNRSKK